MLQMSRKLSCNDNHRVPARSAEVIFDQNTLSLAAIVVSEKWFKSLPENVQRKVLAAGWRTAYSNNNIALDFLAGPGMEINFLFPDEHEKFREVAQSPVAEWVKSNDAYG